MKSSGPSSTRNGVFALHEERLFLRHPDAAVLLEEDVRRASEIGLRPGQAREAFQAGGRRAVARSEGARSAPRPAAGTAARLRSTVPSADTTETLVFWWSGMDLHCSSQPWPKRSASRSARRAKSAVLASRRSRLRAHRERVGARPGLVGEARLGAGREAHLDARGRERRAVAPPRARRRRRSATRRSGRCRRGRVSSSAPSANATSRSCKLAMRNIARQLERRVELGAERPRHRGGRRRRPRGSARSRRSRSAPRGRRPRPPSAAAAARRRTRRPGASAGRKSVAEGLQPPHAQPLWRSASASSTALMSITQPLRTIFLQQPLGPMFRNSCAAPRGSARRPPAGLSQPVSLHAVLVQRVVGAASGSCTKVSTPNSLQLADDVDHLRVADVGHVLLEGEAEHVDARALDVAARRGSSAARSCARCTGPCRR